MAATPPHVLDIAGFLEENLSDPVAVLAASLALLTDPRSYTKPKTQPASPVADLAHELVIADPALRQFLSDRDTPLERRLVNGRWSSVWGPAPPPQDPVGATKYDVCISFAGVDRDIARRIAERIVQTHERKVFYDEFAVVDLWGEDLFSYLHRVYSEESRFCIILFSRAYLERAWTRHELRAAQTRVLEERASYVLPVALEPGSIPKQFSTTSYWPFAAGDEHAIADAAEKKVNDFIGEHYVVLEEITEALNRDVIGGAILDCFRLTADERRESGDSAAAHVMLELAAIAVSDVVHLTPPARSVLDLVLFSPGPVGDAFDSRDEVVVFDDARVRRTTRSDGALLLSTAGWEPYLTEAGQRWQEALDRDDPDPAELDE